MYLGHIVGSGQLGIEIDGNDCAIGTVLLIGLGKVKIVIITNKEG